MAGWGKVARRGAAELGPERRDEKARPARTNSGASRTRDWQPERWIQEPDKRGPKPGPAPRRRAGGAGGGERRFAPVEVPRARRPPKVPEVVGEELQTTAGARRAPHLARRLGDATKAYERDRYDDARRILKELAADVPASPAVRELYGLTLYRQARWREALRELGAFHDLTGSYDQHPTMADANRALGRHAEVARLWEELREASPSAELVIEGRIVAAGSRADQGDLPGAIRLLEGAARKVTRPRDHHLRLWYALADLYERAGEVPAARELFQRIVRNDRAFFDAVERLAAL
ncbi:MAG TPA: tetratricopeptide repeat protein [Acidimicrobiales bacterium]|nr:tetratricopeptide repeat protein [Acidimicrobiales bacterium]